MGKKPRTSVTHHRSNHLAGDAGSVRLPTLGKTALPHPSTVVYEQKGETPSDLVTIGRDGWPKLMFGSSAELDETHNPTFANRRQIPPVHGKKNGLTVSDQAARETKANSTSRSEEHT